jgi:hypothetical protein
MRTFFAGPDLLALTKARTIGVTVRRMTVVGGVVDAAACTRTGKAREPAAERRTGAVIGNGYPA